MRIKKNKIYQYIFLLTLTLMAIFNGGNNNLYIQFNFIIISIFFLFFVKEKNYLAHIRELLLKNKIPILVGTQLISKGFHFPSLNCIVVVNSDTNFLGSDIRASEKNFQLLQQLSGRAGREENRAIVFLQTNDSKNKILHSLSSADPEVFYEEELLFRKKAYLPPYSKLVSIIVSGANQFEVEKVSKKLKQLFPSQSKIKLYGPVTAPIFRVRGKFRMRLLIKYDVSLFPQQFVKDWLDLNVINKDIKLEVDVDPINFL